MARFRTIRQRRHRARRGQVSAVATVLALLLIVLFVATFVLAQLPSQLGELESAHTLQVENQLSRLQTTVDAQGSSSHPNLALSSPVTLGSQSLPPFGPAAQGSIGSESSVVQSQVGYSVGHVTFFPPAWNQGTNPCASGTSALPCSGNGNVLYWNFTGVNHTALNIHVTGNNDSLVYNFTGNNDTITLTWSGKDTHYVNVIVNGSDNVVNYVKSASDVGNPVVNFLFYGERNVFTFSPAGSHSGAGGMRLKVWFIGTNSAGNLCPYANLAATNRVGALGVGGSNINMSVTWFDAVGYVTPVHLVAYPGGAIPTETLRWSNQSLGFVTCAFSQVVSSSYASFFLGGLVVHEFNRYTPEADVVYEAGAVLLAQAGGSAIMVSPPDFALSKTSSGLAASLTFINLYANLTAQGGTQTAAVTTQVTGTTTIQFSNLGGALLTSPFVVSLSTYYPSAWAQYINQNPTMFPGGASCSPSAPIFAPYTCTLPPPGVAVTLTASLTVQQLSVTIITVQVTLA